MTRKKTEDIANKIKIYMLKHYISQRTLAKKLNISPAAVSKFLTGDSAMRTDTISNISEALGVPANYFFSDDSALQVANGNNNQQTNASNTDLELMKKDMDVLKKTLENLDLRLKILEKNQ